MATIGPFDASAHGKIKGVKKPGSQQEEEERKERRVRRFEVGGGRPCRRESQSSAEAWAAPARQP